jgi:hypothetical protein
MSVKRIVTEKAFDPTKLHVDVRINWRESAGYDIPAMKADLERDGRITESIHVLDPKDSERLGLPENLVLRGNRRTKAACEIINDKNSPAGLVESLKKSPVKMVGGFDNAKDVEDYMLDHGSSKPLSRTEVVHAVWRLQNTMHTEAEIGERLYQLLARYTGNTKKAQEVTAITDTKARRSAIVKWLHGTVGNFLMAVNGMGEAIREQLTLTSHKEDGILTKEEEVKFILQVTRGRVTELSAAKTKDKAQGGWEPVNELVVTKTGDGKIDNIKIVGGGVSFNEKLESFVREDAGEANGDKPRPTAKTLEALADSCKSPSIRAAYLQAAGKKVDNILDLDAEASRQEKLVAFLKITADRLENEDRVIQFSAKDLAKLFNTLAVSNATVIDSTLKAV